jgi:hypothetical protein
MFTIVVIGVLGWTAYKFFRFNTSLGTEAVRAYYYLEACLQGEDALNANRYAHFSITGGESASIQRAVDDIRTIHNGKQGPLIAEAYRRGMLPMIPTWYRNVVTKAPVTPAIHALYQVPLASSDT